jgi:hypothetical protein
MQLVKGGQVASVTAKILGIPRASLKNWVGLNSKSQLKVAGDKPVRPEQKSLAHHFGLRDTGSQRQRPLRALAAKVFGPTQQVRS